MIGYGWKWLEWLEMARNDWNCLIWPEMAGMAGNDWK